MADWEEIKRLAAEFQRVQSRKDDSVLCERNCLDIIKLLKKFNLIDLIHTVDGKGLVTSDYLAREIQDEVQINGGRQQLNELAIKLNVDYQHIENIARKLDGYNLVRGQLIHPSYQATLEKQIRHAMMEQGYLKIAEFSKKMDLPPEYIKNLPLDDFVPSPDHQAYYTRDMMNKFRAIVAGTLSAIIKPKTIAYLIKKIDVPDQLIIPIIETLIKEGRIDAVIEDKQFIPAIYAREQHEWIDGFYSTNLYIEYDVLERKDIKKPEAFLKKKFPEGISLGSCYVSPTLILQVESAVEDCITSTGLVNVSSYLPPSIQPDDVEQILRRIFKTNKLVASSGKIIEQTNVCSLDYIDSCRKSFNKLMDVKAKEHLEQGKLISYFLGGKEIKETPKPKDDNKEDSNVVDTATSKAPPNKGEEFEMTPEDLKRERRNKKSKVDAEIVDEPESMGGKSKGKKSGGGTQGREIKQKSVKKKYFQGKDKEREKEPPTRNAPQSKEKIPEKEPLIFMNSREIVAKLKQDSRDLGDFPDELFETIANMLEQNLNQKYESHARDVLNEHLKSKKENDPNDEEEVDLVE